MSLVATRCSLYHLRIRSGSSVGVSSICICVGRQSVNSFQSGLCNVVSSVGASERIVTI